MTEKINIPKLDAYPGFLAEYYIKLLEEPENAKSSIKNLASDLRLMKMNSSIEEWNNTINVCRNHSLRQLVHEDPLSLRAYSKPRNYQGDAQLLDAIYRKDYSEIATDEISPIGKEIFSYTIECKAPAAVRARCTLLAEMIDSLSKEITKPDILSVACGHLREAHLSEAVRAGNIGRLVGLDQDVQSLALVNKELSEFGIETINGSVKALLSGALTLQKFDFIYSTGLYDYLEDRFAKTLTSRMFEMLRPNGRLLIANYMPDIEDVGYMETYMDWRLIYRDEAALISLLDLIPAEQIKKYKVFAEVNNNILFLEIERT